MAIIDDVLRRPQLLHALGAGHGGRRLPRIAREADRALRHGRIGRVLGVFVLQGSAGSRCGGVVRGDGDAFDALGVGEPSLERALRRRVRAHPVAAPLGEGGRGVRPEPTGLHGRVLHHVQGAAGAVRGARRRHRGAGPVRLPVLPAVLPLWQFSVSLLPEADGTFFYRIIPPFSSSRASRFFGLRISVSPISTASTRFSRSTRMSCAVRIPLSET